MLSMARSSAALNSASDCCADSPSVNAREKLATMSCWRARRALASSCVMSDAAGWKRGEVGDDVMEGNLRDVVADCGMRIHCVGRKRPGCEP